MDKLALKVVKEREETKGDGIEFNEGDIVFVYVPHVPAGFSRKIYPLWRGPYTVTARTGAYNYKVRKDGKESVVNVRRMLKYVPHVFDGESTDEALERARVDFALPRAAAPEVKVVEDQIGEEPLPEEVEMADVEVRVEGDRPAPEGRRRRTRARSVAEHKGEGPARPREAKRGRPARAGAGDARKGLVDLEKLAVDKFFLCRVREDGYDPTVWWLWKHIGGGRLHLWRSLHAENPPGRRVYLPVYFDEVADREDWGHKGANRRHYTAWVRQVRVYQVWPESDRRGFDLTEEDRIPLWVLDGLEEKGVEPKRIGGTKEVKFVRAKAGKGAGRP